jgi:MoaA/NifB/PqqE/SkfB family radical SAM enzyme
MIFDITEHCSLGCPHCMIDSTPNNKHCNITTLESFINFGIRMDTKIIGIGGGEPTEHPSFFDYMVLIFKAFSDLSLIILLSNGRFLKDDSFTENLADLQKVFPFYIQISVLKGIYPHREETIELYKEKSGLFKDIALIEEITIIDQIGRAKGKDWSHLNITYKRKAPCCFNIWSTCHPINDFVNGLSRDGYKDYSMNSLHDVVSYLEWNTKTFCKPLIAWDGSIYAGESTTCVKLGNIKEDSDEVIFNNLKSGRPCEKCGVKVPHQFNFLFE